MTIQLEFMGYAALFLYASHFQFETSFVKHKRLSVKINENNKNAFIKHLRVGMKIYAVAAWATI